MLRTENWWYVPRLIAVMEQCFRVDAYPERTGLEPVPNLRQRYRDHRALKKACITELKSPLAAARSDVYG